MYYNVNTMYTMIVKQYNVQCNVLQNERKKSLSYMYGTKQNQNTCNYICTCTYVVHVTIWTNN